EAVRQRIAVVGVERPSVRRDARRQAEAPALAAGLPWADAAVQDLDVVGAHEAKTFLSLHSRTRLAHGVDVNWSADQPRRPLRRASARARPMNGSSALSSGPASRPVSARRSG